MRPTGLGHHFFRCSTSPSFRFLPDLVFVSAEHSRGVRIGVPKVEGGSEVFNIHFGPRLTLVCVHLQRLLRIGQDELGKMVPARC